MDWLVTGVRLLEPALCCLRILDLRHCGFGAQGTSHLSAALKHADCKLEVLRLDGNRIKGNVLSRGLLGNESLRELHLAHTDIGNEGMHNPLRRTLGRVLASSSSRREEGKHRCASWIQILLHKRLDLYFMHMLHAVCSCEAVTRA